MGILDDLLAGGQREKEFKDFVTRYEQGDPADSYTDQEVIERYRDVAHAVPEDEYAKAAQEALARLSPEERAAFVRLLQERAQARGVPLPAKVESDSRGLSQVLTELHRIPGRLRDMLSGGDARDTEASNRSLSNIFASPIAKAALAGITAMVARRVMQGR
jgi:hypothetical protein